MHNWQHGEVVVHISISPLQVKLFDGAIERGSVMVSFSKEVRQVPTNGAATTKNRFFN